ncbi:MAG: hypothetical protein Q4P15_11150 [Propionibacteriaceae bacterium]|nr:hypothetical protein [Propionibacteriaceae bacterium]
MRLIVGLLVPLLLVGCVSRPDAAPATMSTGAPPWTAPRDAISHIRAAGLPELGLDSDSDPFILKIRVSVDGQDVPLPAFIGIDRLRAIQAPVHTHESSGDVWLEGDGNREVDLGQFFTLWGVRFDDGCLGGACEDLSVIADGETVEDPASLVLRGHDVIEVSARTA